MMRIRRQTDISHPVAAITVLLTFVLGATVADECGTKFVDPSSSAVLAQIVVQGSINSMRPESTGSEAHSADVTIGEVFKGMDVLKEMGLLENGVVTVGRFGPQENRDDCVASMSAMTTEETHMFFLRPAASHGVLEMTALPLPSEPDLMAKVKSSLCDTCVQPPKIKRVMCRQCASAPVIRKVGSAKARMGRQARLRCYAKGKPHPTFSWTKAGLPITSGSGGITIRSTRTSSILRIRKTTTAHAGEYICHVENPIGRTENATVLEILKGSQANGQNPRPKPNKPKYNVRTAPDKEICSRTGVCLNGGTCYFSPSLDLSYCACVEGFEGVRCENNAPRRAGGPGGGADVVSSSNGQHQNRSDGADTTSTMMAKVFTQNPDTSRGPATNSTQSAPHASPDVATGFEETTVSLSRSDGEDGGPGNMTIPPVGLAHARDHENEGMTTPETEAPPETSQPPVPAHMRDPPEVSGESASHPAAGRHYSNVDEEARKLIIARLKNSRIKAVRCPSKRYCLNGGNCRYVPKLDVKVCLCREGFQGERCEERV